MKRLSPAALAALLLWSAAAPAARGQVPPAPTVPAPAPGSAPAPAPLNPPRSLPAPAATRATPPDSGLDAPLFYQLLLGELNARGPEPTVGFSLMLDAARKTDNPALYQRAVALAFQARSGEAALEAAQAWKRAHPQSREANRTLLQILVALNRVEESVEPLRSELAMASADDRPALISVLPRTYSRVVDKKQASTVVERALADYLQQPGTAPAAWTAVGRLRLAAGDEAGALQAAQRAQAADPTAEGPALLALELMEPQRPQAEALVRNYLAGQPIPELRMAYARTLLDAQRNADALEQLRTVTRERPEFAEAWLAQGMLLTQDNQLQPAEAALRRYLEIVQTQPADERSRAQSQAFLALAQLAEKRGDFAQANAWLDRIENAQELLAAQSRRASLLARQGRLDEARALLQAVPERTPDDARRKLMAEIQLLREHKQYQPAYDLLAQAAARYPDDHELRYEQAMVAEKLGRLPEMEQLLRAIMAAKPDFHHAYNALGYSLADRGVRLQEARELIEKALQYAPGDPFITDSLGWVHYRMGNKAEALRVLQQAYAARPDPEIAAHLGEVLWDLGQRERAQAIWREGLMQGPDNETLKQTIERLGARL